MGSPSLVEDAERRPLPVQPTEERRDRGDGEHRMREASLDPRSTLDLLDDLGVVATAEMEEEMAPVRLADADPLRGTGGDRRARAARSPP